VGDGFGGGGGGGREETQKQASLFSQKSFSKDDRIAKDIDAQTNLDK